MKTSGFHQLFRARVRAREAVGVASGVVLLVLDGGAHPERAVQPGRVLEPLDVLEDRRAQLRAGGPAARRWVVHESLLGQGREKRLRDRVRLRLRLRLIASVGSELSV